MFIILIVFKDKERWPRFVPRPFAGEQEAEAYIRAHDVGAELYAACEIWQIDEDYLYCRGRWVYDYGRERLGKYWQDRFLADIEAVL